MNSKFINVNIPNIFKKFGWRFFLQNSEQGNPIYNFKCCIDKRTFCIIFMQNMYIYFVNLMRCWLAIFAPIAETWCF